MKFTTQHDLYQLYQNIRVVNCIASKFVNRKSFSIRFRVSGLERDGAVVVIVEVGDVCSKVAYDHLQLPIEFD